MHLFFTSACFYSIQRWCCAEYWSCMVVQCIPEPIVIFHSYVFLLHSYPYAFSAIILVQACAMVHLIQSDGKVDYRFKIDDSWSAWPLMWLKQWTLYVFHCIACALYCTVLYCKQFNGLCILHSWYMMLAVYMAIYTASLTQCVMCMHRACTLIPSWGPNAQSWNQGMQAMPQSQHSQAWSSTRSVLKCGTLPWPLTFDLPRWGHKRPGTQPTHPIIPP